MQLYRRVVFNISLRFNRVDANLCTIVPDMPLNNADHVEPFIGSLSNGVGEGQK